MNRNTEAAPRVSVVVPAFNSATLIEPTLRSALEQTLGELEVIVVDDGSTDETSEVVQNIASRDGRVRLIRQDNRGIAAARNRGVAAARGAMVGFLDHDDLWHPDKLALQVALLDAKPEVAVAYCYSAIIDDDQRCSGWRYGGKVEGDVYGEILEWDMVSGGSVALVRREALASVGPFDETLPLRSDWDMWIRLARAHPFAAVPYPLVGYTRGRSSSSRAYERMAEAGTYVLANVKRDDPSFRGRRERHCRARDLFGVACACTVDGEVGLAWRYVAKSLALSPVPLLRRPRRWALVAALGLQTVLPARIYRELFGVLSGACFKLPVGRPFSEMKVPARPS